MIRGGLEEFEITGEELYSKEGVLLQVWGARAGFFVNCTGIKQGGALQLQCSGKNKNKPFFFVAPHAKILI